ncbi:MAG: alpha/beta fold hydrolase [Anaerolineae bacterium]
MPYTTLETGERLFYAHRNNAAGVDVLFVHGAGGTHRNWGHQVQGLAGANTFALDLPGHGRSGGEGRDAIAGYSDVILRFLDALNIERVILVGHSMGGGITLWTALCTPDRLLGIGLVGTGARLRVLPAILDGLMTEFEQTIDLILNYSFGFEVDQALVKGGREEFLANNPAVARGDFVACDQFDVMTRLGEIELPAAVVVGVQDRLTPPKYARYLADHLPDSELTVVQKAGHMVMLEQPEAVTQALQKLVDRCR